MSRSLNNHLSVVFALLLLGACDAVPREDSAPQQSSPPAPGQGAGGGSSSPVSQVTVEYQGIDVSHFDNDIEWSAVRSAGKSFAFIKATEGVDLPDPHFVVNWQGAKEAGLVRGAYHFFVPEDDPKTQAEFFISHVQLAPGDLAPTLDVEYSKDVDAETLRANIKIWLEAVETAYGITPILYTDVNFANDFLASGFERYPLWIADYAETAPTVEGSWVSWDFWQYSENGEVDGVETSVDLNVFQGSEAQWRRLLFFEENKP